MSSLYADVIIDIFHSELDRSYQYRVPSELLEKITIGTAVKVPFGKGNRSILGYIINLTSICKIDSSKIKDIIEIESQSINIESQLLMLASWMSEYYGTTQIAALKTVLPISKKIKQKEDKYIHLLIEQTEARELINEYQTKKYTAMTKILLLLLDKPVCHMDYVKKQLNVSNSSFKSLVSKGIIKISASKKYRNPYDFNINKHIEIDPTIKQQKVIDSVLKDYNNQEFKTYLLHGVTGSGKTEVYIRIIREIISRGRQVIVLIPEIALTYQTVKRFYERFGNRVGVLHSKLSQGERYDQYIQAKEGKIDIMIGPRSALFTPFSDVGLVIIDEEHETTYKSDTNPKYHAKEVAIKRMEISKGSVLLGSATPSLETYYNATEGNYKLLELDERIDNRQLPDVDIIDMREELEDGNKSMLSKKLRVAIEERLMKRQQIIIFINRRGFARFVSCRNCGYVVKCTHCDVAYTYHNNGMLMCHYCGRTMKSPAKCPSCTSKYIKHFGIGTQKVEEYMKNEFSDAKIIRMDMDTTTKKNSHDRMLQAFSKGEADILIGTQMIAKGHDFPNVTLVGVLAADLSLYLNDFRASEKTFDLLTQVAGRAGRGSEKGDVIIQTYSPDHYSIICSKEQNYKKFYEEEIEFRRLMNYSPFSHMLVLLLSSTDEKKVIKGSYDLRSYLDLEVDKEEIIIDGPSPASISKINNIYRRVLYIRASEYNVLLSTKKQIACIIEKNKEIENINVGYYLNPMFGL